MSARRALALLAASLASAEADADLLAGSGIMRRHGLRLVAAEVRGKSILLVPQPAKIAGLEQVLLGSDGKLHALKGDPTRATRRLSWGCNRESPAARLVRTTRGPIQGRFVVFGKAVDRLVRWYPARRLGSRSLPDCIRYRDGYRMTSGLLFRSDALARQIYFGEWAYNNRDAVKDCGKWGADVVGAFDPATQRCETLHAQEKDCNGSSVGASARSLVGVLKLGEPGEEGAQETWLVFQAKRGSGPGFSFMSYAPGAPAGKPARLIEAFPWSCR